jgi:hypothetical protein
VGVEVDQVAAPAGAAGPEVLADVVAERGVLVAGDGTTADQVLPTVGGLDHVAARLAQQLPEGLLALAGAEVVQGPGHLGCLTPRTKNSAFEMHSVPDHGVIKSIYIENFLVLADGIKG